MKVIIFMGAVEVRSEWGQANIFIPHPLCELWQSSRGGGVLLVACRVMVVRSLFWCWRQLISRASVE